MSSATLLPPRKKFTRAEVDQMERAGVLEGQRLELIDGELIDKMGQNPPHAFTIRAITALLARIFSIDTILIQSPIEANSADQKWSLPEPDLAVLAEAKADYAQRLPRGNELLLAIEVADSTLRHDSTIKRDLYARAAVPEYWVVDVSGRKLIVHRHPAEGEYRVVITLAESENVSLESQSEASFTVTAMLP